MGEDFSYAFVTQLEEMKEVIAQLLWEDTEGVPFLIGRHYGFSNPG